jgi:hypothetical protein
VQINYPTDEVLGDWACATSLTLKNKQKDAEIYNHELNNYQESSLAMKTLVPMD